MDFDKRGEYIRPPLRLSSFLPPPPPPPPPPANAPHPTVQTGQYRAAAGLSGFRGASSTSSEASSKCEAEVHQPASRKWPSTTCSGLQGLDISRVSSLGFEDTSREAEERQTKGELTQREDTYWSQKRSEESCVTRQTFDIRGREAEETYWTYRVEPEVGSEVSRRELGRALGGRMSSRCFFQCPPSSFFHVWKAVVAAIAGTVCHVYHATNTSFVLRQQIVPKMSHRLSR